MKHFYILITLCLFISCAGTKSNLPVQNYKLTWHEARMLTDDLGRLIKHRYGSIRDEFILIHRRQRLGRSLEKYLRRDGFGITSNAYSEGAKWLTYTVTPVPTKKDEPDTILVSLAIDEIFQANRLYYKNDKGELVPKTCFSIIK